MAFTKRDVKAACPPVVCCLAAMIRSVSESLTVNVRQSHRLATHEDGRFFHAHKTLGLIVLAHFAYRLRFWWQMGCVPGLGLDDGSWTTLALISVHLALHASSFQFALPRRRNLVYNTIWPEMRWHSAFFAARSLVTIFIMWLRINGVVGAGVEYLGRSAAVLLTMVAADAATRAYKTQQVVHSTMRDNPYPEWAPEWARRALTTAYSTAQLFATLVVLFRDEGHIFMTLLPIQTAPLLMTLVKKGIITPAGWHLWYSAALFANFLYHPDYTIVQVGNILYLALAAITLRFGLGINKYVMWSGFIVWGGLNGALPGLPPLSLSL